MAKKTGSSTKTTKTAKTAKTTSARSKLKGPSDKETNLIRRITLKAPNKNIPTFHPGDTVNVFVKVREGEKERIQVYKGIVTKLQGSGAGRAFTVRKISAGVGVERTFPFGSPALDRVELVSTGKVRRAKLYYLRGLEGKASKIESELAGMQAAPEAEATPAAAE